MPTLRTITYTVRPLQWDGPRTPEAARVSTFSAAWSNTLNLLDLELFKLDARNVVLQLAVTDAQLRLDGGIRADARVTDPAARLLFDSREGALGYACDRFRSWQENVRAIALGLEALRKVDRYGIGAGQQYKGYRAIEGSAAVMTPVVACAILARVAWPNEAADRQAMWAPKIGTDTQIAASTLRKARANSHPDRLGGDRTAWDQVEQAARVLGLDQ